MPPKMLIRTASVADLIAINNIYNHYVLTSVCTYQEAVTSPEERRAWFEARDPRHPITVVETEGQIVGFGALSSFRERSAYRFTVENSLYVRHDMMGQGIGSAILADLIRRAADVGCHSIIAVIDAEQASSIRLHERFGFVRCAHLKQVGFKMGRWLDVIYLEYLLPTP